MRKGRVLLYIMVCAVCAAFCGCGDKEEEIPMGRYADREVELPPGTFAYMHPCPDGSYYLYGLDAALTYVDAQGKSREMKWSWENSANIHVKYGVGVSDKGAAVFSYTPKFWVDEELEALWLAGDNCYLYCYVDENGRSYALEPHGKGYRKGTNLNVFAFSPEGELYAASEDTVHRVNVENGETESLFATAGSVESIVFAGSVMLAADREKAYFYDMAAEKLLDGSGLLDEFIKSHSTGGLVMAVTEGNAQILYMACSTGLYRYIWGGSVIEQIADGQMTALGDTQRSPSALQALDNGEFRVMFDGNFMVEMYYDETLPARPAKELTVYSLEESGWIRYAGQLFQKKHPDVLVRYETGMDGDNAVSREDALKNLNTRLLAGDVPDVIVLDRMDIEQYADKGVLRELDGILQPYLDDGILYRNIVEGMRMTENEKIYSVPMMVYLPLWLGEEMYLEGADGSLDVEKLTAYYEAAEKLWKLDSAGFDDAGRKAWQKNNTEHYAPTDMDMADIGFNFQYSAQQNFGETWLQFGFMLNPGTGMTKVHVTKQNMEAEWQKKELEDSVTFGTYTGQADNVYWAKVIAGLCEKAKEPELAEDFFELLLSDEMMRKWWLDKPRSQSGITIRKDSLGDILDINNVEFGEVMGWKDPGALNEKMMWPTEEEKQWLYQMMEDASCCYRPGTMLEECAMEAGIRVLTGELTPEEGAKEVERKMAIEMEE